MYLWLCLSSPRMTYSPVCLSVSPSGRLSLQVGPAQCAGGVLSATGVVAPPATQRHGLGKHAKVWVDANYTWNVGEQHADNKLIATAMWIVFFCIIRWTLGNA
jgi:hypothetical protein